jgi:hypothetical protein
MARYGKNQDTDVLGELYRRGDVANDDILDLKRRKHNGAWANPTLINGWAQEGGTKHPHQYRLLFNDTLDIRGGLTGGASGTVAYILPEPWRPLADVQLWGTASGGSARYSVNASTGEVTIFVGGDSSSWVIPTLINGWSNAGAPYDDIAYRHAGTNLEFKGHVTGGASGTIAFYLQAAYWPTKDLSTITDVVTGTTPGAAQIYIRASDGAVLITTII